MAEGITVDFNELLALQQWVHSTGYPIKRSSVHLGMQSVRSRGRGMTFAEARNYQAGDEIRHMEWRITARTGKPHIKLYQEEQECPVVIMVDFNASMYFGTRVAFKSVTAAKLTALLAWTVVKQKDKVGGLLFSANRHDEFTPKARESGVLPLLAALSAYTHEPPPSVDVAHAASFNSALLRVRHVARPGTTVVLVSDFYGLNEESEKHLRQLSQHNTLYAYYVCDPLELALPKRRVYAFSNGQDEVLLNAKNKAIIKDYEHGSQQRIQTLTALFRRMKSNLIQVSSDMDLPALVRSSFARGVHG